MIKDVEYAFFAQLSYLNWNKLDMAELKNETSYKTGDLINFLKIEEKVWNKIKHKNTIEPKVENGILMYDEADKRLFGVFGIERDENKSNELLPYYDFNGWQFIYSADNVKLFKERYNLEVEDNGFFACAFMKENDIVIAYRGTEPDSIEDLLADLEIGFLNHSHSQLVCAYLFLEHVKSLYPGKNINITGHSLGGCLAQYAFVCTGKKYPTVTWNALGLGKHKNTITDGIFWGNDITDYIGLYSLELQDKLEEEVLDKNGNIKNEIILLTEKENIDSIFNILNPRVTEIYEKGEYIVGKKGFFSLKFVDSNYVGKDKEERNILTKKQKEKLEEELRIKSIQIYWLLRGIKNYQLCFKATSNKIKNYYNSKDWTALLQTREGETVDVLTEDICEQEKTDDTKIKIAKQTLDKSGFNYHGVNDFLLYMNKEGMIEPGKYNEIFTKNLIKTIYEHVKPTNNSLKLKIFKENSEKYTDKENPFQKFHILATKKRTFLNNMTLVEEANIKYFVPAINSISSDINEYISYIPFLLKPEENDEIGVYIVGQLSNVTLAGIKGGVESQLIKVFSKKEIINEEKYLKLENKYINLVKKSYGINN